MTEVSETTGARHVEDEGPVGEEGLISLLRDQLDATEVEETT